LLCATNAWGQLTKRPNSAGDAQLDDNFWVREFILLSLGPFLFRLARHAEAAVAFRRLAKRGILARSFAEWPDRLRFGLMEGAKAKGRVEKALAAFAGEEGRG